MSARYGMVIDVDRCTGCGSCMMACAAENNVPALPQATARTGLTPLLVRKVSNGNNGADPPRSIHSHHVHALRARHTLREGLPAAGRGSGPGNWNRDADAATLPGLPLLHDRLSLSRALLQLVGSGVAPGNGKDSEPGSRRAHARRRGEVQSLPRAAAFGQRKSGCRRKARNRSRRLRSGLRRSLPHECHSFRRPGQRE